MKRTCFSLVTSVAFTALLCGPVPALAQTAPPLGAVQSFAVLGGSGVTAAGPAGTVIDGDVGSAPTSTVDGFPPAVVTAGYTIYTADNAVTANARTDATTAYGNLASQVCPAGNIIAGGTLGGLNLVPGVYCMAAALLSKLDGRCPERGGFGPGTMSGVASRKRHPLWTRAVAVQVPGLVSHAHDRSPRIFA